MALKMNDNKSTKRVTQVYLPGVLAMISGVSVFVLKMVTHMTPKCVTITECGDDLAILNTTGMQCKPTHPDEMLREGFLPGYELTVSGLAESLGVPRQSVNEL